jgi:excinuclease ABC subunit A
MFQPTDPVPPDAICIHGAREHNLKNLSLEIPREKLVVVTGVSGSGKSTLAFDLLFAEGQRRFLDSMNVYARQFVEQLSRPDVALITGIPPTVSIEQRHSRGGGKSTVATVTEVYHFIRLLFARLGTQFCPDCNLSVEAQTRDEVGRRLRRELKARGDLLLLAPVVRNRKGFHTDIADWAARHGYAELRADGKMYSTQESFRLDRFREHNVEIVLGVLGGKKFGVQPSGCSARNTGRLESPSSKKENPSPQDLIDEGLRIGQGTLFALDNSRQLSIHSTERSCPHCGRSFEPLDPKNFSYNSPQGWCLRCRGFGELFYMPEDVDRGAREDAIAESWYDWQEGQREICPDCKGSRLNSVARAVRLKISNLKSQISNARELTIDTLSAISVQVAQKLFGQLRFSARSAEIARDILPEIRERLNFLCDVGLGYLQLGRGVPTLSGGESQRIRLSAQLGSNLSGVLYILDEPTIGLHARDNRRLLDILQKLKARGNSVLVVEHDEDTMRCADFIVDLGPGAGIHGGQVVAAGTLPELLQHPESITGQCLRARKSYPSRGERRPVRPAAVRAEAKARTPQPSTLTSQPPTFGQSLLTSAATDGWLTLHKASKNNLKNLTVRFPLGRLVFVTGVSGSGKSTLVRECLLPAVRSNLKSQISHLRSRSGSGTRTRTDTSETDHVSRITGHENIQAVYEVDQSPIGRTPRSVPATYVGFFDDIRQLFAQVPEARLRGYGPGRFSFNSPQGRCPECAGAGQIKLEMNFLPPAFVRCGSCGGCRFNRETLDIQYGRRNIAEVLELSM